jgi:hypothetical protein
LFISSNLLQFPNILFATQESDKSRNALIREAIDLWLKKNDKTQWPVEILEFGGEQDFPSFESNRDDLKLANEDPLA